MAYKIVMEWEDGERSVEDAFEYLRANKDDPDVLDTVLRMRSGQSVRFGGGAAPLCKVTLVRR
jgi:hypothetical protein